MAVWWAVILATTTACGLPEDRTVPAPAPAVENEAMFNASDAYERFMGRWSRQMARQPSVQTLANVPNRSVNRPVAPLF
jgi:hypothetical protein